jgi:hypothetical protein
MVQFVEFFDGVYFLSLNAMRRIRPNPEPFLGVSRRYVKRGTKWKGDAVRVEYYELNNYEVYYTLLSDGGKAVRYGCIPDWGQKE